MFKEAATTELQISKKKKWKAAAADREYKHKCQSI